MASQSGRGLVAGVDLKRYPFMEKSPVPIRLETSAYAVTGNMHVLSYEKVRDELVQKPKFLPLTQAEVYALADDTRWQVPFVAVNREQIMFLEEEASPR
jgi:uncharacterized membrane protein